MRAIELRIQRAIANPRQDSSKFSGIAGYVERIDLALKSVPELALAPMLYEFVLLFEEMRIAVFAPEIRTLEKVSTARISKAWDELRY